jgi:hypothetical protein
MNNLVADGTVDLIGLGRSVTFLPNYRARILTGEQPALPTNPHHTATARSTATPNSPGTTPSSTASPPAKPQRHRGPHTVARAITRLTKAAIKQATIPG